MSTNDPNGRCVCAECGCDAFYYSPGFPGNREEPEEPQGWFCERCDAKLEDGPDDPAYPDDEEY